MDEKELSTILQKSLNLRLPCPSLDCREREFVHGHQASKNIHFFSSTYHGCSRSLGPLVVFELFSLFFVGNEKQDITSTKSRQGLRIHFGLPEALPASHVRIPTGKPMRSFGVGALLPRRMRPSSFCWAGEGETSIGWSC